MKYTNLSIFFSIISLCLRASVVSFAAQSPSASEAPLPAPRRLPAAAGPTLPAGPSVDAASQAASPIIEETAPAPREVQGLTEQAPPRPPGEESAPRPREQTPSPQPLLPSFARVDPLAEVHRLHQQIEGLRLEREAMLLEEIDLITAKEVKTSKGDEMRQLRQRITTLLTKAAQQRKKQAADKPPSRQQAATGKEPGKQSLPDGRGSEGKAATVKERLPSPLPNGRGSAKPDQPTPITQPDSSTKVLTEAPVDPLSLARSLFLSGDHASALNVYRKLEQEELKAEDRIAIQYMIACCLRKLGKSNEASTLYREVANSRGSDILVENAQWYLRAMKDRRELEAQLDEMRQRRQSLLPRKP